MKSELENLLKINEMYQKTIRDLEHVIEGKDRTIAEYVKTISKLTSENTAELQDIRNTFFTKQNDLVQQIKDQKEEHVQTQQRFKREIKIREKIDLQNHKKIDSLEDQLFKAKKILRDPELNKLANRRF